MEAKVHSNEFGRLRSFLWPIHVYELKKLIPLLLIFFLISLNYNILRTLKDTVVITEKEAGAEVIPFIKLWVMFPASILLTFLFTRLSNRMNREMVFYVMVGIFLVFYCFYTFLLYPMKEVLHLDRTADWLQMHLPLGCKGMIAMIRNWTGTIFYVMCELWSNIIFAMLLWGFTNQVTRLSEASRFYAILGVGANFSGVVAGYISVLVSQGDFNEALPFGKTAWDQSIIMLTLIIASVGLLTMVIFRWFNKSILSDERFYDPEQTYKGTDGKGKISMRACIRYLLSSRYLVYLAVIVIGYNIVINLVEVLWKHQVNALYPNAQDYNLYMNQVSIVIGIIATLSALFLSGNSIRNLGWSVTALMTPVILLVTSILFFGAFFLKTYNPEFLLLMGLAPGAVVVFFGTLQNMLSRAAKYTVFDATREMAFVPLTQECKIKGKAVVDGLCSRLGKSGGSIAYQTLLITFSSIPAASPVIAVILFTIIGLWTGSTYLLGKEFNRLTGQKPSNDKLVAGVGGAKPEQQPA